METKKRELRKAFEAAVPTTIPVMAGFLVLGVAYGLLMQSKGYGPLWTVLMSAIAFCGSMQYVAITLLTIAFDPIQAFLLSIMVNARHLFYGISMLGKYKGLGKLRFILIYTLCDETFSIVSSVEPEEGINRKYYYLCISLLDYFYWVFSAFLGSVLGNFITINMKGMDFVLTALFVVLFMEQWKHRENRPAGIIGICCTAFCLVLFGADSFVIPAMILILVTLMGGRKRLCTYHQ